MEYSIGDYFSLINIKFVLIWAGNNSSFPILILIVLSEENAPI